MNQIIKILFTILVLLSFCELTFGKQIDENTAKTIGQYFLNNRTNSPKLKIATNLVLAYKASSKISPTSINTTNLFYVFNVSNGFVIVSSDDNVLPILGYSDEGVFDPNNNPTVMKWLESYKNQIRYAIENGLEATDVIKREWNNLLKENDHNYTERPASFVNPLVQTRWSQSPYVNAFCPYDISAGSGNGYHSVTGCPATAMAQIMKYWNYPATGTGFHSYNHSTYGTLSANFGSTSYQWSSMPNTVSSTNNAVATLMYHCGVAVEMSYGPQTSASYVIISKSPTPQQCSEYAYKTYFGYDENSIQGKERTNYTDANWKSLLKNELDNKRPIQYAGFGGGSGHTFVCDGYDANEYFHMNWGWGGNADGYFLINALNPGGGGTGSGTGTYNSGQQAVIGIKPPSGGTQQNYNLQLYSNINMLSTQIWFRNSFNLTVDIANLGTGSFSGQYGAAIFDNNYNFVDFMEIKSNMTLNSNYHYTTPLTFSNAGSAAFVPGTYYVAIFYKTTTQDWTIIGNGSYTNLKQFKIYYSSDIETNSAFTITSNGGKLIKGSSATINVDVINKSTTTFKGQFRVTLAKLDGSWAQDIQVLNENSGLPYNYHYTNGNNFTGTISVAPGTYLLEVAYKAEGSLSWYYAGSSNYSNPIYVIVEAPALQEDIYESNNIVGQSYNLPISFSGNTATLKTTGSSCHIGTDFDYYKLNLATGYNYTITARLQDSYNSNNGQTYTVDAQFAYSTDGITWSDSYDDIMPKNINSNGGMIYFFVSPYFIGTTGTYILDLNITRTTVTGVDEVEYDDLIKVFPNPAKDFVIVDVSKFNEQITQIQILNTQGQQVYCLKKITNQNSLQIPLNTFSNGMYIIKLQSKKKTIIKRLIIN